jgi:hypothetical protein
MMGGNDLPLAGDGQGLSKAQASDGAAPGTVLAKGS